MQFNIIYIYRYINVGKMEKKKLLMNIYACVKNIERRKLHT